MSKLSNADRNRILARSLFVDAEKGIADIAQTLNVGEKTIQNYQSKDKNEGYDWLTMRAAKHIQASQESKENMYSMFVSYMYESLKEIRENEKMPAEQKAQLIVSLGDSFSKMGKVARQEDPEAYKFGIIKITIEKILLALKEQIDLECMEKIIEVIYEVQDEIADVTI